MLSTDKLLFGYHMPSQTFPGTATTDLFDRIAANVLAAEAAGFDLVTVMDHFYQISGIGQEDEPMLEAYTLLGALAARTSRVHLGCMVTGVTYRNPALLAEQVTTLDAISKGRAVLGIGAAWNESEHIGLGFPFPPVGERMDMLEEAVQICRLMLAEERPTFDGRHYRIERALNSPRPVQDGGPPIMIGGQRRTPHAAHRGQLRRYLELVRAARGAAPQVRGRSTVTAPRSAGIRRRCLRTVMIPIVLVADHREDDGCPGHADARAPHCDDYGHTAEAVDLLQPYSTWASAGSSSATRGCSSRTGSRLQQRRLRSSRAGVPA